MTRTVVRIEQERRWVWRCDRPGCPSLGKFGTTDRASIPAMEEMAAEGWFIAKSWGDRCPACVLNGLQMAGLVEAERTAAPLRAWLATVDEEHLGQAVRVARRGWHGARRWEDPLPLPAWVEELRTALGPAAECYCETCRTSDERAARAAEYQRLLVGSLRAQCEALGHVPADSSNCSRCGEALSHADWSALVADEAASYTWVPTPTEQTRINATLAHAGQHNAGDSPAEVLAFADELDAERDAAAKEGL